MRLLILGGTAFLGRHVAEQALAAGDAVTTFTRGKTGAPPEGAEALHGDRDGDLGALAGRTWDAVIDTSGYVPRVVDASSALLADAVEHCVFVSSISVYADPSRPGLTEDAPVAELPDPASEDVAAHYGALKARCEAVVAGRFPDRSAAVRAGLIVGPGDYTHRFTYWVDRLARPGRALAPEPAGQAVQLIDVRDLAAWLLRAARERVTGTFNATGTPTTLGAVLETCRTDGAELVWVDEGFLLEQGVQPWDELPLWLAPSAHPELGGFLSVDVSRALAAGLSPRPLADTVEATRAWSRAAGPPARRPYGPGVPVAGLTPEREAALLAAWDGREG
jgi:2'-hydroxyisoflavone reductase